MTDDDTNNRWWVLDAVAHRIEDNKEKEEWLKVEEPGVTKIASGPDLPNDLWVCDWCNSDIPIKDDEGTKLWVPMFLNNALCPNCMYKEMRTHPRLAEAFEAQRSPLEYWSHKGCPCDGCVKRLEEIKAEAMEAIRRG